MDSTDIKNQILSPFGATSAKLQFVADFFFLHLHFKSSHIILQSNRFQSCRVIQRAAAKLLWAAERGSVTGTIFRAAFLRRPAAGQSRVSQLVAEFFISPTFSQLLAKAANQIKPVCPACDRILAIERLHTLTARTDECFNTYKSQEGKNRARRDHSRAPRLDMLIAYQLSTGKPDVEGSRIQVQKTPNNLSASRGRARCRSANRRAPEMLCCSATQIPAIKNLCCRWKLNLNPLLKKK